MKCPVCKEEIEIKHTLDKKLNWIQLHNMPNKNGQIGKKKCRGSMVIIKE